MDDLHVQPELGRLIAWSSKAFDTLRRWLLLFGAAFAFLQGPTALACSCLPDVSGSLLAPVALLDAYDVVFVGKVEAVESVGCGRRHHPVASMRVLEAFKGAASGELIDVRTWDGSCGVRFRPGQEWLVFTTADEPGVHYCEPSTGLAEDWYFEVCEPVTTAGVDDYSCTGWTEEEVLSALREAAAGP